MKPHYGGNCGGGAQKKLNQEPFKSFSHRQWWEGFFNTKDEFEHKQPRMSEVEVYLAES